MVVSPFGTSTDLRALSSSTLLCLRAFPLLSDPSRAPGGTVSAVPPSLSGLGHLCPPLSPRAVPAAAPSAARHGAGSAARAGASAPVVARAAGTRLSQLCSHRTPPNRSHSHLAPASRPSGLAAAGGTPPGKRWGARRGRRVAVAGAVARSGAGQGCLCAKSGTSPGGGEHCGMRGQAARAALRGGGRGRSGDAAGLAQASGRCTAGGRRAGVRRGREGARERSWRGLGRCPSQCSCPPPGKTWES